MLAEKVSVLGLGCAGSVFESAVAELLQSVAQREWPALVYPLGRPSTEPHTFPLTKDVLLDCRKCLRLNSCVFQDEPHSGACVQAS